jgi:L-alanine-DL-glutamate epimerase-like enolase superfamily enzyme
MSFSDGISRRQFLKSAGAGIAGAWLGQHLLAADEAPPPVFLKSWEVVEIAGLVGKSKQAMKIIASNGEFGICKLIGGCKDLKGVEEIGRKNNLLDHEKLHDAMTAAKANRGQLTTFDIACWDLHARMLKKPLHAVLGTKRTKILRYGDVRGQQPDFSPEKYAKQVAAYLDRSKLQATKLHFPGAMGTKESIEFKAVLETLRQVRKAVGAERMLAWDPYPGSAESATTSVAEAKEIIGLMDELGYAWIEGPLPPMPFEEQIPKYVELMKTKPKLRIQAEGPGSPIGDGTPFDVMKQWVEAGAVNQCSTDAYIAAGLTNAYRFLEYARKNRDRKLVINLHWEWAPHAHLAMAYEEETMPVGEFVWGSEVPKEYMDGPYLKAPDWPGIYKIDNA